MLAVLVWAGYVGRVSLGGVAPLCLCVSVSAGCVVHDAGRINDPDTCTLISTHSHSHTLIYIFKKHNR